MSQIYKCDFCGTITDDIAGEVWVRPKNGILDAVFERENISTAERARITQMDGLKKDACEDCIQQFVGKPVKIKVLEAQVSGDL